MPSWGMVEVDKLVEPRNPQRRETLYARIDELRESIRVNGLQQPIGVQREGQSYRIIFGHRRSIAVTQLQWSHCAALIYAEDEAINQDVLMGGENYHRNQTSDVEEADFYDRVCRADPEGTDGIARKYNVPRARIERMLSALYGNERVRDSFRAGRISVAQAFEINQFKDKGYQLQALNRAEVEGTGAVMLRKWRKEIERQLIVHEGQDPNAAWANNLQEKIEEPHDICNIGNHSVPLALRKMYAICNPHYNMFLEGLEWKGKCETIFAAGLGKEFNRLLAVAEGNTDGIVGAHTGRAEPS